MSLIDKIQLAYVFILKSYHMSEILEFSSLLGKISLLEEVYDFKHLNTF